MWLAATSSTSWECWGFQASFPQRESPFPRRRFRLDIPVMIAVAVACLPIFFTGHLIARWEGALFLAYYCAYTASIVIAATVPSLTRTFAAVMFGVVVPLTIDHARHKCYPSCS